MATGYTQDIQNGKTSSLRDFTLLCARAMSPLARLRDTPFSDPIPVEFKHTDLIRIDERITELEDQIALVAEMSNGDWEKLAEEDYQKETEWFEKYKQDKSIYLLRYNSMLEKVQAWTPDERLQPLKDFMISQIENSIEDDCVVRMRRPERRSLEEYKNRKLQDLKQTLAYRREDRQKEIDYCKFSQEWLDALHSSLSDEKLTP